MDRTKMIDEILTLTPDSPARQARSRPLLNGMTDTELHDMHEGLAALAGEGRRALDTLPATKRAAFLTALHAQAPEVAAARATLDTVFARVEARKTAARNPHTQELMSLARSIRRWRTAVPAVQAVDLLQIVRDTVYIPPGPPGAAYRRAIEHALFHPVLWSESACLDQDQTNEALARVQNHFLSTPPGAIVAMNQEGQSIAQVVAQDLGLTIPIFTVHGSAGDRLEWQDTAARLRAGVPVCIVGHVAWSGETIQEVVRMTRQRFGGIPVSVAVLAASTRAAERTDAVDQFIFHQVTMRPTVMLSFDATEMRVEAGGFHFSAQAPASGGVIVSKDTLARKRDDLRARYLP